MLLEPSVIVGQDFMASEPGPSKNQFGGFIKDFCAAHCSANPPPVPPIMPKLQVFKKDGHFFALDVNVLKLYQALESGGLCQKVEVDLVGKGKIPRALWEAAGLEAGAVAVDNGAEASDFSDTDDEDEDDRDELSDCDDELVCVACGTPFPSVKKLTDHQVSKRHFGCTACGDVFSSMGKLGEHKATAGHGSTEDLAI